MTLCQFIEQVCEERTKAAAQLVVRMPNTSFRHDADDEKRETPSLSLRLRSVR